jgi:MFS family permease
MHSITRNKLLVVTYMLTMLYALHYGIPLYATSSYLHESFNASWVSMLYMFGSIGALIASMHVAKYIKRFHTYGFTFGLTIFEILITIAFGLTHNIFLLGLFFIVHFILQTLLYICLNVFIESFSKFAETGSIRGLFLALLNIGIVISPVIGGTILSHTSFEVLYIVSSLILIPFIFFLHKYLSHVHEPAYHSINMLHAFGNAWRNKNLRAALIASLSVECFYAVMIIYSPIYLSTLGISLTTYLTFILPLALIPLVVLPYELGLLADTKFGEKELMIIGLAILAITTFLIVIVTSSDPRIWIGILLISRIGAACVETMAFTYYFKKIGPEDASLTAVFSNTRSVVILGCVLLWNISSVLPLQDTR